MKHSDEFDPKKKKKQYLALWNLKEAKALQYIDISVHRSNSTTYEHIVSLFIFFVNFWSNHNS